ncbi:MAG: hypothetical protein IJ514_03320 [Clostridia bacterium]|nr:hypothetical protein [Clostridia bacterium]
MGYVLVLIASVCYAGEFALVKYYQKSTEQKLLVVFFMLLIRYAVGAVLALCCSGFSLDFSNISPWMTIVMSGVFVLYNVLGVAILSRGNLAIYSMFMMVGGMLLPMLHGVLFMKESLSVFQIVGTVLLVAFMALQTLQFKKKDGEATDKKDAKSLIVFTLLCLLAFIDNGSLGIIRTHELEVNQAHEYTFAFSYCLLTAAIGGCGVVGYMIKDKQGSAALLKPCVKPLSLLTLVGIGCIANIGDILLLVSTGKVPESVMYPIVSGATIVFSAIAALLVFKEKMKTREIVAVIGAALATVLFIF